VGLDLGPASLTSPAKQLLKVRRGHWRAALGHERRSALTLAVQATQGPRLPAEGPPGSEWLIRQPTSISAADSADHIIRVMTDLSTISEHKARTIATGKYARARR
jgi:hypothetical protein